MTPYYEQDGIVLHCGKCEDILHRLYKPATEHVITDPPYRIEGEPIDYACPGGVGKRIAKTMTVGEPWCYSDEWLRLCLMRDPANLVVFCNGRMIGDLTRHIPPTTIFVWRKSNAPNMIRPVPRLDCEFVVWRNTRGGVGKMGLFKSQVIDVPMLQAGCFAGERILLPGSGQAAHPCQKPLAIVAPFVSRMPPGDILDPFAGTGTTLVAAKLDGRKAVGIESNAAYCAMIVQRLQQGVLFGTESRTA